MTFTPGTLTTSPLMLESATPFQATDGTTNQGNVVYTFSSYFNLSYSAVQSDPDLEQPAIFSLLASFQVNHTAPNVAAFTLQSCRVEVLSDDQARGATYTTVLKNSENNARSVVQITGSSIGRSANFGGSINLKVYFSYVSNSSTSNPVSLAGATPAGSVSFVAGSCGYTFLSDLDPLYDSLVGQYGWLPTMNTNIQTLVGNTSTTNLWLSTVSSQVTTANSWLSSIQGAQQVTNSHLTDVKNNQVHQSDQLDDILDYLNATAAADVLDQANDDFVQQAGQMETGQAALEADADDAIDAVDSTAHLNIMTMYRQSINFWMRCVNALPSVTGAFWDAFIFGVFLAFIMFILRLSK